MTAAVLSGLSPWERLLPRGDRHCLSRHSLPIRQFFHRNLDNVILRRAKLHHLPVLRRIPGCHRLLRRNPKALTDHPDSLLFGGSPVNNLQAAVLRIPSNLIPSHVPDPPHRAGFPASAHPQISHILPAPSHRSRTDKGDLIHRALLPFPVDQHPEMTIPASDLKLLNPL